MKDLGVAICLSHSRKTADSVYPSSWRIVSCLLALVITLAEGGCWNRLGQDADVLDENERIAAQVKVELVREPGLDAAPINIKVHDGVVTLEGFLEDESKRQQATQAALRVSGVQSVLNKLQIK